MGMAASQARYLALVARKSNCEYEGQQINQARLVLSNQSSELFNQMLGMDVPKAPSKSDYTYTTYTFTDGDNEYIMTKWNHLADASDGYNYVVTYSYEVTQSTGFQRFKRNPQIQFSGAIPTSATSAAAQVDKINNALNELRNAQKTYNNALSLFNGMKDLAARESSYQDKTTITAAKAEKSGNHYTVTSSSGTYTYTRYSDIVDAAKKAQVKECMDRLAEFGTFDEADYGDNYSNIYYNPATDSIAFAKDLDTLTASQTGTILPIYHVENNAPTDLYAMQTMITNYDNAKQALDNAKVEVDKKQVAFEQLSSPILIGNTDLQPMANVDIDADTSAAITKIIKQMQEDGIECNLEKCFNTSDGTYDATTYIGGLYKFDWTTSTYYTSYYDLYNSVIKGTGVNNIDDQAKLPYYGVQDMDKEIKKESRALIEKDKSGRFVSIRLEDDSYVYDLTAVSKTDEIAYEDAMNQYDYDKAMYDKRVQELNAQTSIIQRQDKDLELRLKQLDTEQNALATEIDAVAKVVKDNVEKSFKTFGG